MTLSNIYCPPNLYKPAMASRSRKGVGSVACWEKGKKTRSHTKVGNLRTRHIWWNLNWLNASCKQDFVAPYRKYDYTRWGWSIRDNVIWITLKNSMGLIGNPLKYSFSDAVIRWYDFTQRIAHLNMSFLNKCVNWGLPKLVDWFSSRNQYVKSVIVVPNVNL